jgi:hypothetical protein
MNVIVKIKRDGKTIARVATDRYGRFRSWLPNRSGRYAATADQTVLGKDVCTEATSVRRMHVRRR